jgi:type III secretory pathway component EscR
MTDPYYTIKVDGWKQMIEWVKTKDISFKEFCMKNKMDYILFSGYESYIEKMSSHEERLAFVKKQLYKCEAQYEEYIKSITPACCK